MPDREGGSFIPPTENAQRIARRETCACGDVIELPFDASRKDIETALTRHQRTPNHRAWWNHVDLTGEDW